jgi:hypothetical protein
MAGVDDVDGEVEETKISKNPGRSGKKPSDATAAADPDVPDAEEDDSAAEPDEAETEAEEQTRSEEIDEFWAQFQIEPVELALPKGSGFTLRAYRMSTEVTFSEVEREEDDFTILERPEIDVLPDEDEVDLDLEDEELEGEDSAGEALDEDEPEESQPRSKGSKASKDAKSSKKAEEPSEDDEEDEDASDEEPDEEDEEEETGEEVPVFLGHSGQLFLFETAQALVDFVKSDEDHDLAQLEGWSTLRESISVEHVIAKPEDRYELDLVVENLRGGQDVWDVLLIIRAGEVARDLACALRITPVFTALAPGSPLDHLDEALRAADAGGIGGFFARRRLRKIGAQQAALGWRTIIGKISGAVLWR